MADIINPEQNGYKSDLGKRDRPSGDAGDDLNNSRSQRRHYHDFNKSSVFDFLKGPNDEETNEKTNEKTEDVGGAKIEVVAAESKPDLDAELGKEEMEHKQKRHFNHRNRSTFDL